MSADIALLLIVALCGLWRAIVERRRHIDDMGMRRRRELARMNYGLGNRSE